MVTTSTLASSECHHVAYLMHHSHCVQNIDVRGKAAQQRTAAVHLMLGFLSLDGEGTKRDNAAAVAHLRRAASLGNEEARAQQAEPGGGR